jgi:hypothetical protein
LPDGDVVEYRFAVRDTIPCSRNSFGLLPNIGRPMVMRFTVIDPDTTVSFCGAGHLLKMATAVVADGAITVRSLIDGLAPLDDAATARIRSELAVFDEHCLPGDVAATAAWFDGDEGHAEAAFRVVDELTRRMSTRSERLGLVLFNLNERRIVQVQNSYGALRRQDRGRIRNDAQPTSRLYRYRLPEEWSIVP